MIPSYQEELRIRKNKDRIFWLVVFIMTVFLYFFFQGYYPNYERFLNNPESSKQAFLKPFGIIDIHVFPSPDGIFINNERYNNNSKTIFDLGEYLLFIQKKWYLPVTFLLDITKKNPFFTNVVNLLALPEHTLLPLTFDELIPYDDLFLLQTHGTGSLLFADMDFRVLHRTQSDYRYVGGIFFTDGTNIFSYSRTTETFLSVVDQSTKFPLQCRRVSYYGEKLFCHDTMNFIGPKASDIREKILAINDSIVVTPGYIYNQDMTNTNWKYFEYQTGALHLPEAVVHINKIPHFLEKGVLSTFDRIDITPSVNKHDWWMNSVSQAREFNGETILIGEQEGRSVFRIIDAEKQYSGIFDFPHTTAVTVYKINGIYVFTTPTAAYIYYKGAKEIMQILNNVEIVRMVDSKIFFNTEGKSYVIDLLRKEKK